MYPNVDWPYWLSFMSASKKTIYMSIYLLDFNTWGPRFLEVPGALRICTPTIPFVPPLDVTLDVIWHFWMFHFLFLVFSYILLNFRLGIILAYLIHLPVLHFAFFQKIIDWIEDCCSFLASKINHSTGLAHLMLIIKGAIYEFQELTLLTTDFVDNLMTGNCSAFGG